MNNQHAPKHYIQLALLESLVDKNANAERMLLALRLEGLECTPQLLEVMCLHEAIDANLKALQFAMSLPADNAINTHGIEALQNKAFIQNFLGNALKFSEWLQAEYTAGNPDAICFVEEWLTIKADYSARNPELEIADSPLDDFSFIPELRQALAILEDIGDNLKPLNFDLFIPKAANTNGVKAGGL